MFGSWAIKPDGRISERTNTFNPRTRRTVCLQACNNCRLTKLKCTGEKSGCRRCKMLSRTCAYDRNGRTRDNKAPSAESRCGPYMPPIGGTMPRGSLSNRHRIEQQDDDPRTTNLQQSKYGTGESGVLGLQLPGEPRGVGLFNLDGHTIEAPISTNFHDIPSETGATNNNQHFDPDVSGQDNEEERPINSADNHQPSSQYFMGQPSLNDTEHQLLQGFSGFQVYHGYPQQRPNTENGQLPANPRRICLDSSKGGMGVEDIPETSSFTGPGLTCPCTRRIIPLMDEVEDMLREGPCTEEKPELMLATHKEVLGYIHTMLGCSNCTGSAGDMTLLTFFIANLARVCQRVSMVLDLIKASGGVTIALTRLVSSTNDIYFQNYNVDSVVEYEIVVRGLLGFQIHALNRVIEWVLTMVDRPKSQAMIRRLKTAKGVLVALATDAITINTSREILRLE